MDDIGFHPKWVVPFYGRFMGFFHMPDDQQTQLAMDVKQVIREIDDEMIVQMLASSNWRPRLTAAYFVGFGKLASFTDNVGECFLKYPHYAYPHCLALTRLGSSTAIDYLKKYMSQNLTTEQITLLDAETLSVRWVLASFQYFDEHLKTSYFEEFYAVWEHFVQSNRNRKVNDGLQRLLEEYASLEQVKSARKNILSFLEFTNEHFD